MGSNTGTHTQQWFDNRGGTGNGDIDRARCASATLLLMFILFCLVLFSLVSFFSFSRLGGPARGFEAIDDNRLIEVLVMLNIEEKSSRRLEEGFWPLGGVELAGAGHRTGRRRAEAEYGRREEGRGTGHTARIRYWRCGVQPVLHASQYLSSYSYNFLITCHLNHTNPAIQRG